MFLDFSEVHQHFRIGSVVESRDNFLGMLMSDQR